MSALAALLEQKLVGVTSYFGNPNCLSTPDGGRLTLASTTVPSSPSLAASRQHHSSSLHVDTPTGVPENEDMPRVASPVRAARCFARSGTIDEGSLSSGGAPQNLGTVEPLSTLKDEFKFNKSFGEKVDGLVSEGYAGWRRIRGDGNCFYRAVGFSLLEQIILADKRHKPPVASSLVQKLRRLRFQDSVDQLAHDRLVGLLSRAVDGLPWQEGDRPSPSVSERRQLLEAFGDTAVGSLDQACIRAVRRLTAQCIIDRADDDSLCGGISFRTLCEVQGLGSPQDFCDKVVLPMGVEAESVVMNAVVAALDVGLRLALLHRSEQSGLVFEDYEPPSSGGRSKDQLVIHVQLRPGHYDLLYLHLEETPPTSPQRRATLACDAYGGYSTAGVVPPSPARTLEPDRVGHFR